MTNIMLPKMTTWDLKKFLEKYKLPKTKPRQ